MAIIPSIHIHNFSYISVCTHVPVHVLISNKLYNVHVLITYPSVDMIDTK